MYAKSTGNLNEKPKSFKSFSSYEQLHRCDEDQLDPIYFTKAISPIQSPVSFFTSEARRVEMEINVSFKNSIDEIHQNYKNDLVKLHDLLQQKQNRIQSIEMELIRKDIIISKYEENEKSYKAMVNLLFLIISQHS
jgi:hypothetical protein